MLTRLRISGFKNLYEIDVPFGPFTCIAGANGVGKSNLFDAIRFLSALSDHSLIEAASSVRDENGRSTDVWSLFQRVGVDRLPHMQFDAEMIVPKEAWDDLGQRAKPTISFLRYSLVLTLREPDTLRPSGGLEISREELSHITHNDATKHLSFPHTAKWRKSAVTGRRSSKFISTEGEGDPRVIKLHQDGGQGRAVSRKAASLPRTVLSTANAAENPTVLLAKREMQSWKLLQLEPTALRRPDPFTAPPKLAENGAHLASTLHELARHEKQNGNGHHLHPAVYSEVANRLAELISDVRSVTIDRDDKRELLTLFLTDRNGTKHPAHALSDGTLRFLALAVLELDSLSSGLICLEEPENGIHPERIPAMLELLQDIAVDPNEPAGQDNPLRQVIINTHSPSVVQQVPEDSLLLAQASKASHLGREFSRLSFACLPDTWRAKQGMQQVSLGKLLGYLNPVLQAQETRTESDQQPSTRPTSPRRVIDRPDLRRLAPTPLFPETDAR
jgi:predicted ATPase